MSSRLAFAPAIRIGAAAALAWFLAGAASARATTPVASPHGSLKEACSTCHGSKGWKPARISKSFDHAAYGYRLEGSHRTVACLACHQSLDFAKAETECASCHQDPHRGEFGSVCARCHTPKSFLDRAAMTRLHQVTKLPLVGAHLTADCEQCHAQKSPGTLQFVGLPAACQACHISEYNSAQNPNHVTAGFSVECERCHRPISWHGGGFDHNASGFPLTGAHRTVACASCHVGGVYTGTPRDCVACHQNDYNGTTDPNHTQLNFPTTCASCHSTTSWAGATFDHNATGFPLTGAHTTVACLSCHVGGVFAGTNSACVACHQTDYNNTTNPNHASAGFPTTCQTCHTTSNWNSTFTQHDALYFPIYSGAHQGRWSACADCHNQPSNYAVFNCLGCHPHDDKATTDSHHSGVNGYQYASSACYSCHPQGRH